MNLLMKKLMALAMLLMFSFGSFAAELLTLQDLRDEVLSENLDIKIQYEKYYQAQKRTGEEMGEFLPNLSPQLLFWNTTYGILYSISPNPSSWFEYRASGELAHAEKYVSESIKLNILRDLTLSFMSIKHQEKVLASMEAQEPSLVAAYEDAVRKEELGVGDPATTFLTSRKLMQHRQQILALKSAIAIQKEGLLRAINKTPADEIVLGELPVADESMLPASVEEAVEMGVKNAPELVANTFLAEGARYMQRAAKWSFVSFSGIGFGYPSTNAIERSRAREIELEREQIKNKIENQIALAYEKMSLLGERMQIQLDIVSAAEEALIRATELNQTAQVPYDEVLKAEETLYEQHRNLTKLEMEKRMQVAETKRLLGLDATEALKQEDALARVEESATLVVDVNGSFGRKKVSVNVELNEELKSRVVSLVYSGDVFDYRISGENHNYHLYTKVKGEGEKLVKATLLLENGKKIELQKTIHL